jgi:hypothetical protein
LIVGVAVIFQVGSSPPQFSGVDGATYLGDGNHQVAAAVTVDDEGNVYLVGRTNAGGLATTGAYDTSFNGSWDVFVVKYDSDLTTLRFFTYLGSGGWDQPTAVSIDAAGNVCVSGQADGPTFPVTPGAFDIQYHGGADAFFTKLDPTGSNLIYSTFYGGNGNDNVAWHTQDSLGRAVIVGNGWSTDLATTPGAFQTSFQGGWADGYVAIIDPAGNGADDLAYASYFGTSGEDSINRAVAGEGGTVYLAGSTQSSGFPTTPGAYDESFNGGEDLIVIKLDPARDGAEAILFSTFIGGGGADTPAGIVRDGSGNILVAGVTRSGDFPTTPGALQVAPAGGIEGCLAKLSADGANLIFSTYLGGSGNEMTQGLALDGSGNPVVTGGTASTDFPTTPGAFDDTLGPPGDAFVAKIDLHGTSLLYSTYLGGSNQDDGSSIALDAANRAYVAGTTQSNDFPNTSGGHQPSHGGGSDAYVARLGLVINQAPVADAGETQTARLGEPVTLDGSGSYDPDDEPIASWWWSFTAMPPGSAALLTGADTPAPTFTPDVAGDYAIELTVSDAGGLTGTDQVEVSSLNARPNADAGSSGGRYVGDLVTLDGSGSSDPDEDPLSYSWSWVSQPPDSTAVLLGADTVSPVFIADVAGTYEIQLLVNDGYGDSEPAFVLIAVILAAEDFAQQQAAVALNELGEIPAEWVTTKGNRKAMENFLLQVIRHLQADEVPEARMKLEKTIERTDGCALRLAPDPGGTGPGQSPKRDYILRCEDQALVYPLLRDALEALSE